MMKTAKAAWLVRWEAEQARYYATPAGKATKALFAAAEKAGMAGKLGSAGVEVIVETYGGETKATLVYDAEHHEDPAFVFPRAEWFRAKAWLEKYAAKQGWTFGSWYAAP